MSAPLVRRSPVHTGVVVSARQLTPRMRRVTVQAESMREIELRPAQDVELHLRAEGGRRVKRRYTIRHARPQTGELDLDVVLHGAGPGALWGATAAPGDEVSFQGPRGKLELRGARSHLLVGDESALPAIAAICEALPDDEPATAVVEVRDAADELPVRARTRWVHRGETPPGGAELLADTLTEAFETEAVESDALDGTHAYLLGETRAMVALRALLEGRGLAHEAVFVKGYWNLGRPDRLAGRAPG
ncbi:MAG TPA: siderophore-interacting protein [Jatrophihabitans sp.]|nr:siderophore-interacting protein [Jatrophihabitans sp.]